MLRTSLVVCFLSLAALVSSASASVLYGPTHDVLVLVVGSGQERPPDRGEAPGPGDERPYVDLRVLQTQALENSRGLPSPVQEGTTYRVWLSLKVQIRQGSRLRAKVELGHDLIAIGQVREWINWDPILLEDGKPFPLPRRPEADNPRLRLILDTRPSRLALSGSSDR